MDLNMVKNKDSDDGGYFFRIGCLPVNEWIEMTDSATMTSAAIWRMFKFIWEISGSKTTYNSTYPHFPLQYFFLKFIFKSSID